MSGELSRHEQRIANALVDIIDYASRVLISASYGSHYQQDKAHSLKNAVDLLVTHLDAQTLDMNRCEAVQAAVVRDARNYTLGAILIDAGRLGGAA